MSFQCIVFDMDGTLTQTNQLIFDSFNFIVQKYQGKTLSPSEITALFGPPEEGALLPIVGAERLPAALGEYLSYYRDNHERLAQIYPGMRDVLEMAKSKGRRLALFTGKGIHTTTITLEQFKLNQFFDMVVTGNDVIEHKPSSEGIVKIIRQFNVKPSEVLMVGDSVADVKASQSAGTKIAAALWDSYARDKVLQMKTDFLFHTVPDFSSWLRGQLD